MILWKDRIDRAEQLYVGYKKEGKWGLRWGFCTSSFEEQLHQLGSGRKQLTCLSGISDKCLMEGLFTKMRTGKKGIYRASNRGGEGSACLLRRSKARKQLPEMSVSSQQELWSFIEEFSQSRFTCRPG